MAAGTMQRAASVFARVIARPGVFAIRSGRGVVTVVLRGPLAVFARQLLLALLLFFKFLLTFLEFVVRSGQWFISRGIISLKKQHPPGWRRDAVGKSILNAR